MTVLYVLDDTEEGGGTVFPLADTTDEELAEWQTSTDPLKCVASVAVTVTLLLRSARAVR